MLCGDSALMWLPMPGQTWAGAAASFLAMWVAMMIPMMTPSLAPALRRYRQTNASRAIAGAGYFFVWALLGVAVYPLVVLFADVGTPTAAGLVVIAAGLAQFSAWKRQRLACCRDVADCCAQLPAHPATAWLHGMHLGVRCAACCGNLMAVLFALGLMDFAVMAAVTSAITLERLAPVRWRMPHGIGIVVVGAGLLQLAR